MKWYLQITTDPELMADVIAYARFTLAAGIGLIVSGLCILIATKGDT